MRSLLALCLLFGAACGRVAYAPLEGDGSPNHTDSGDPGDSGGAGDSGSPGDSGTDASAPARCSGDTSGVVALYTFDGASTADSVGAHDGTIVGSGVTFGAGPTGCGSALRLEGTGYVEVRDDPAWDLETGSLDFWVHVPDGWTGAAGLVSRDATGESTGGHVTIWISESGRIVTRLQPMGGLETYGARCAEEAAEPGWHHVGFNFGAPDVELWIDGVQHRQSGGNEQVGSHAMTCLGDTTQVGLDGNDNPWVLGASSSISDEGAATPLEAVFTGGMIDHVRVSSIRRDFSMLAP